MKRIGKGLLFGALLAATPALALEDSFQLSGQFDWILSDDLQNQYPGGQLEDAQKHLVPRADVAKVNGDYEIRMTLPPALAGGQSVVSVYKFDRVTADGQWIFKNPARPRDWLECNEPYETWADLQCGDVTMKGLQQVPLQQRLSYTQQRFGGTSLAVGMREAPNSVAGAEPAGRINFWARADDELLPWVGRYNVTYVNNGQAINATMILDGYIGSYQAGSSKGSITDVNAYDDELSIDWQMGNAKGWARFTRSGNGFVGEWGYDSDDEPRGTWNGTRVN